MKLNEKKRKIKKFEGMELLKRYISIISINRWNVLG